MKLSPAPQLANLLKGRLQYMGKGLMLHSGSRGIVHIMRMRKEYFTPKSYGYNRKMHKKHHKATKCSVVLWFAVHSQKTAFGEGGAFHH